MEQKLQEQLRTVAEYEYPNVKTVMGEFFTMPFPEMFKDGHTVRTIDQFDYHTNIASLYPVAKKVLSVLEEMQKNEYSMTISVMTQKIHAVAFDLDMLFIEIFDAIDYLNELNQNK